MKYLLLNPLGDVDNEDYCFSDNAPDGGVVTAYDLKTGRRLTDKYPQGFGRLTLAVGEDNPGLEEPSYLGNTDALLIVNRQAAGIIKGHEVGEVEVIPFKLLNHRGRVHSEDYVFLNPVGTVDCLDMDRSEKDLHKDGTIMNITRYVLSAAKLAAIKGGVPHLFRIKEDATCYVFSEVLVADLKKHGCTNFVFDELEVV
jgi:hypothetical protein